MPSRNVQSPHINMQNRNQNNEYAGLERVTPRHAKKAHGAKRVEGGRGGREGVSDGG